jgi:hypothetical protein
MLPNVIIDLQNANRCFSRIDEQLKRHIQGFPTALAACGLEFLQPKLSNNRIDIDFFGRKMVVMAEVLSINLGVFTIYGVKENIGCAISEFIELAKFEMNRQGVITGEDMDGNVGYSVISVIHDYILVK